MKYALQRLITLCISLFMIILGSVSLLIFINASLREKIADAILTGSLGLFIFGTSLIAVGLALLVHLLVDSRKTHFRIKSSLGNADVTGGLIEATLSKYWKSLFPQQEVSTQVQVHRKYIEITSNLPYFPFDKQKELLLRIEDEVADLLESTLDYRKEFILNLSFAPAENK